MELLWSLVGGLVIMAIALFAMFMPEVGMWIRNQWRKHIGPRLAPVWRSIEAFAIRHETVVDRMLITLGLLCLWGVASVLAWMILFS